MKKRLQTVFIAAAILVAGGAFGATYTLKDGATDWTDGASYNEQGADPSAFTSGDIIQIPDNVTVYLSLTNAVGDASTVLGGGDFDVVNSVSWIQTMGTESRLIVTIGDGLSANIDVPISNVKISTTGKWLNGTLIKRGTGELNLRSNLTSFEYYLGLTVEEGTLVMPQDYDGTKKLHCYVGVVAISNNATLVQSCSSSASYGAFVFRSLWGEGTVLRRPLPSNNGYTMFECSNGSDAERGSFAGRISGALRVINVGAQDYTGTQSDFGGVFDVYNGKSVGVAMFGNGGSSSSTGSGNNIVTRETGGKYTYLGTTDEVTTKDIYVSTTNTPNTKQFILDGGEHGGVTFNGAWSWLYSSSESKYRAFANTRRITLAGDHANPCAIGGAMSEDVAASADSPKPGFPINAFFTKAGSGTWRFKENRNRKNTGGFWFQKGVMQYDSLAEKGRVSSLGTSTNVTAAANDSLAAHSFLLGPGAASQEDLPVLEFTGTNGYVCSTRMLKLTYAGGVLRNNTERRIRLARISNYYQNRTATLVLDGSGMNTNEVLDVSDGAGTVAVVKDGTGVWRLGGDQTFSGPLTVKQGRLIVKQTDETQYTWFRFTLKEQNSNGTGFRISQMALYSATNSAGAGTTRPSLNSATRNDRYSELEPGQVAIGDVMPVAYDEDTKNTLGTVERMLTKSATDNYGMQYRSQWGEVAHSSVTNPASWLPIIVRLPDGAGEIIAFDYQNVWYTVKSYETTVKAYSLEGSVDGVHWEEIISEDDAPVPTDNSWIWTYGGNRGNAADSSRPKPITARSSRTYSVLNNVATVKVFGGAVLEAEGNVTLSKLTVDASDTANGDAEVCGFGFAAENGTLDIENLGTADSVTLPLLVTGSQNAGNMTQWSVYSGGSQVLRRMRFDANGRLVVYKRGTLISLQ